MTVPDPAPVPADRTTPPSAARRVAARVGGVVATWVGTLLLSAYLAFAAAITAWGKDWDAPDPPEATVLIVLAFAVWVIPVAVAHRLLGAATAVLLAAGTVLLLLIALSAFLGR